ncbi:Hypothetical protein GSB_151854, partial [Giardia duodenalis]
VVFFMQSETLEYVCSSCGNPIIITLGRGESIGPRMITCNICNIHTILYKKKYPIPDTVDAR